MGLEALSTKQLRPNLGERLFAGVKYHRVHVPFAHNHPYLLRGQHFEGLSQAAKLIDGVIVGVDTDALLVRTVARPKVLSALHRVKDWENKVARKLPEAKSNWQDMDKARNYIHPPDIELFSDAPIFEMLGNVEVKVIADLGMGNGALSNKLARNGARVDGIDISPAMIGVASERAYEQDLLEKTSYNVASIDNTGLPSNKYDAAISSLVINNSPSVEVTTVAFKEAVRILKAGGKFVVSLPNPTTLDARTASRWTEWSEGQPENLKPGDPFVRMIQKADGMEKITNNYWPPEELVRIAEEAGLKFIQRVELLANDEQIKKHKLDEAYRTTSFFMVLEFQKP